LNKLQESIKLRQEIQEQREREVEIKRLQNQQKKMEIRTALQIKKEDKFRQIQEEAKLLKLQKQYNEELAKFLKIEEQNNNKNKFESMKGQKVLSEEKKRAMDVNIK
jgi:hypothetical protein